jgi:hypothetical protein
VGKYIAGPPHGAVDGIVLSQIPINREGNNQTGVKRALCMLHGRSRRLRRD